MELNHNLPPQSIDTEESIIAAMMLDNYTLIHITDILDPEDFYRTAHQKICVACFEMFEQQKPVDLVTLAEFLKSKNQLDEIGGPVFLAKITDTAPIPGNIKEYCHIVKNKAVLRQIIKTTSEISQQCFDPTSDFLEVLDSAQQQIMAIQPDQADDKIEMIGDGVVETIEYLKEISESDSNVTGISSGYSDIDDMLCGFQNSDLYILAARPAMGKTALALNFCRNASMINIPTLFISLEQARRQLQIRGLAIESGVSGQCFRSGNFKQSDWGKIMNAAGVIETIPLYIDDKSNNSFTVIKRKIRRNVKDKGVKLVVIDYLQLMTNHNKQRRDLDVSEMSRGLKLLAKELDLPIIALSQLNRAVEERTNKRPKLSDLRESGAIEQDADTVMFIYRDEVYNDDPNNLEKGVAEIIIAKQRSGPIGTEKLMFHAPTTRFRQLSKYPSTVIPQDNAGFDGRHQHKNQ